MSCERALFYRQICEQCRAGQVWQNTSEVKEVRGRRRRSVKWNRSAASPLFPPPPATSWFFLHSKRACQRHWSLLLVSAPSCCLLSLFAIGVAAFLLHAWRYRSSYSRVLFIPSAFDVSWQSLSLVFPSSGGGPIFFFFFLHPLLHTMGKAALHSVYKSFLDCLCLCLSVSISLCVQSWPWPKTGECAPMKRS